MMKNCGGAFSAYLKMPSAAFRYFSNFLHLHLHYPLPSTFIQLPCVKKAGLRQGSLASDMIIFTDTNTVQIAHTLSAVKTEGLLPPTIPFPPSPPTALCPEIQIRAAGATIILHSSLFIISSACGNTTIPLSLSSSPSCGTFPSHSYPHLFLSQNI